MFAADLAVLCCTPTARRDKEPELRGFDYRAGHREAMALVAGGAGFRDYARLRDPPDALLADRLPESEALTTGGRTSLVLDDRPTRSDRVPCRFANPQLSQKVGHPLQWEWPSGRVLFASSPPRPSTEWTRSAPPFVSPGGGPRVAQAPGKLADVANVRIPPPDDGPARSTPSALQRPARTRLAMTTQTTGGNSVTWVTNTHTSAFPGRRTGIRRHSPVSRGTTCQQPCRVLNW